MPVRFVYCNSLFHFKTVTRLDWESGSTFDYIDYTNKLLSLGSKTIVEVYITLCGTEFVRGFVFWVLIVTLDGSVFLP